MYQKNYYTESAKTRLMLDKNARKAYNEKKGSIFDEDDIADSALSYLYNDANKSKTQGFLKSNGFPTLQQRAQNQQLYGAAKEQKQIRDLLKSTANNTLNPNVTKLDHGFLQGIYGDEEGDRAYYKMLSDASQRQSDMYNAFQGSPFESILRQSTSIREISPTSKSAGNTFSANMYKSSSEIEPEKAYHLAQYPESNKALASANDRSYNDFAFPHKNSAALYADSTTGQSQPRGELNREGNAWKVTEPAPKAVRANVENAGGSVDWDSENKKATIKINGYTEELYVGDEYGTFIKNGVMYTDDLHLNNIIYAPTYSFAKSMYDEIKDDFGKFVLRTWLFGDGSEVKVSGKRWNNYMKNNPVIKQKFSEQTKQSIRAGQKTFEATISVTLDGEGGYKTGYELINGSNADVGNFKMKGKIEPRENDKYSVTIAYIFNDIIDPNEEYRTDRYYSKAADFLGVSGKDYVLRISGIATFTYSDREGIVYE